MFIGEPLYALIGGRVSPTWRAKKIEQSPEKLIQKGSLEDYPESRKVVNSCMNFSSNALQRKFGLLGWNLLPRSKHGIKYGKYVWLGRQETQ